jgi:hypothetical protein
MMDDEITSSEQQHHGPAAGLLGLLHFDRSLREVAIMGISRRRPPVSRRMVPGLPGLEVGELERRQLMSVLAVGHFTRNGPPGLAMIQEIGGTTSGKLTVLVGAAGGGFKAPEIIPLSPPSPVSVAVGDFNGDRTSDIAVGFASGLVSIFLNSGSGRFSATPARAVQAHAYPIWLDAADFSGRGHADLVSANTIDHAIQLFRGNGDGTFLAPLNVPVAGSVTDVSVGDLNKDGRADLAVGYEGKGPGGGVEVLLSRGAGRFAPGSMIAFPDSPTTVAIGDLNGDGSNDLAWAAHGSTVVYALNSGRGRAFTQHSLAVPHYTRIIDLAIGNVLGGRHNKIVIAGEPVPDPRLLLPGPHIGPYFVDVAADNGHGSFAIAAHVTVGYDDLPQDLVLGRFFGAATDDVAYFDVGRGDVRFLRSVHRPPGIAPV